MIECELSKLKLRLTIGLIELLTDLKVMVSGMWSLAARVLGVSTIIRSVEKALCIARSTIAARARFFKTRLYGANPGLKF